MAEELSIELKKPLDKMTAKELRQLAMDKIPQVVGASGMAKEELLTTIKEALGISDGEEGRENPYKEQILTLKRQIKELRAEKEGLSKDKRKERDAVRRKVNKLKKRTRRLSAAS